ncbi:MAG: hypothetical protein ABIO05_02465 [Ferruginibacter sp.]
MNYVVRAIIISCFVLIYISCSKSDPAPPANTCAGITIGVTGNATNATTGQANGAISATGSGASSLTFSIDGGGFQSTGNFTGLSAGVHTVTAKSSAGCTGSAQFTVGTNNPCAGVTVTVTGTVVNATAANNNGTITVAATGGSGFTYSINGGVFQATTVFNGLAAGAYTVVAKTAEGCTGQAQFTVTNPCTGVTVSVSATTVQPSNGQSNGSINATAIGGSGFTFSLNSGAFQPSGSFTNLAAGTYTVTAKNSNGCSGSANVTLASANPCSGVTILATTTITSTAPCGATNGGIAVSASGGTAPYTFNINGGSYQSVNTFINLAAGTYTITAKDANGCTSNGVVAVVNTAAPGALFTAVKQVMATNCALSGCHLSPNPQNGLDFSDNCTIQANNSRIKARAVDGSPSFMPPPPMPQLSATDKQKIVNWVNAGGRVTD